MAYPIQELSNSYRKTMTSLISYFLYFSCYISFHVSSSVASNLTDISALLSFKAGLISDPLRVTASWKDSLDLCSWKGVTCSNTQNRVIKLDLHSSKLTGPLSPSIGNLSSLQELILHNNSFTGRIPGEIGRLSGLQVLGLENNSFSGEIPGIISNCSKLVKLLLGGNRLVGRIPLDFQAFSNLELFFLYMNNLTGNIPPFLGNITSLFSISIGGNKFSGQIPDSLGRLKRLEVLELGRNNLSGQIPSSFFNLSSLTNVDIPLNQLQGNLPPDLFISLPRLQKLNVARNQLAGKIPSSVSNASELLLFALNVNAFSGQVPSFGGARKLKWIALNTNILGNDLSFMSSLINCTELQLLHLTRNRFEGVLPRFLGNFSKLRRFGIGENVIYGDIPDEIGEITNLETLYLYSNRLTGRIPESIGKLQNLKILSLMKNNLSMEIPFSIGNLTSLTELYLQGNNFQGLIPSSIGKCQFLLAMDVSGNNLSGSLPEEIFSLSSLSKLLDLSSNSLTGVLPSDAARLEHLVLLNLTNNKFSGEIPDGFSRLINMRELYLANNFLYGNISSLSSLTSLEIVDLSCNNFSGQIPDFLEIFSFLRKLNLSFNDFEGDVPTGGVFGNGSQVSVSGNPKLCGGISNSNLPTCRKEEISKKPRITSAIKLAISLSSSICVLILFLLFAAFYCQKHNKRPKSPANTNSGADLLPPVSYQSLSKATNGFSQGNLIGSGKFSSVYKGIINQNENGNERVVAVKVLKLHITGAGRSFVAECEALRSIRHQNLVKILTSCSSVDFQGNDFKALVYTYMENGSLQDWVHYNQERGESTALTFMQRLNVAIDVACALDYLHHHCGTPLVHCDLKPSNVLLEGDFIAHVSDFGLAKFVEGANMSFHISSCGIKGTIGYAAPEYAMGGEPSPYGDVYSYGILLLELFMGKSPTDEVFTDGLTLHSFAKMAIMRGHVIEIADARLVHDLRVEEIADKSSQDQMVECLISLIKIGVSCSVESPGERMVISRVVNELYSIRSALSRDGAHSKV